ncbi:MAG: hypothetical protein GOU98_02555 [Candidatus Altiarchaeota archaeon]|nr:hypothetical protein [Candidatus Altiarchaeota archaeon]
MIKKFFKGKEDEIIFPDMSRAVHKKIAKISILKIKKPEDISKLREKIGIFDMLLVDIAKLYPGEERKSFVTKLKLLTQNNQAKIYGVDTNWLLITKYEVQKN